MEILSVSDVNNIVKTDIESNVSLRSVQVMGEISNFKAHYSGHFYFSLKDEKSKINCVMFSTYAKNVHFKLVDGTKVVITCSIGVYVSSGTYQLYVYNIEPLGVGNLYLEFEALKNKLLEEGIFDNNHKKEIPKYPINIGIISAKEGAAIRDCINTIKRRWDLANITLIPTLVQGKNAASDIINSLEIADKMNFDLIIVARGGGSIEDLWCFNDINVAYKVYNLNTPIISAIGHEIDTTIIDYVADKSAITPTAAAEISTPNKLDLISNLNNIKSNLIKNFNNMILEYQSNLNTIKNSPYLKDISNIYKDKLNYIKQLENKLYLYKNNLINNTNNLIINYKHKLLNNYKYYLNNIKNKLSHNEIMLDSISPLKTINRGYSITFKDNKVIDNIDNININDEIKTKIKDGNIISKIIKIEKEN